MMSNEDLPTLIKRKDHLEVLRYIRAHELREPKLVLEHGKALVGLQLNKKLDDDAAYLATLEQMCFAALDMDDHELANNCLQTLRDVGGVEKESARFRRLLARCLEAAGDYDGAELIYDDLLRLNPCNLVALQRKYCIARAVKKSPAEIITALNEYLGQQLNDVSGWFEMSKLRSSLGDFKGAAFALEQVVLGCPLDSDIHRQLAEVYATLGGLDNLNVARKHMAQSLELDPNNVRSRFGLVSVANQYLEECEIANKKSVDEHEKLVSAELVKYGAGEILKEYKGNKMYPLVKRVMDDYTDNLPN